MYGQNIHLYIFHDTLIELLTLLGWCFVHCCHNVQINVSKKSYQHGGSQQRGFGPFILLFQFKALVTLELRRRNRPADVMLLNKLLSVALHWFAPYPPVFFLSHTHSPSASFIHSYNLFFIVLWPWSGALQHKGTQLTKKYQGRFKYPPQNLQKSNASSYRLTGAIIPNHISNQVLN